MRGVAAIWSPRLHGMANVSNNLIHVTDWLPTLYAAAGGNVTDLGDIDGVNQWPFLSQGKPSTRDTLLLNIDEVAPTEGAIHRRFKLVRGDFNNFTRSVPFSLFFCDGEKKIAFFRYLFLKNWSKFLFFIARIL